MQKETISTPNGEAIPVRILIADDTPETRRTARLMLANIPEVNIVAMAQDGQQTVDLALKHQPDLAIIDVNMPGFDGLTALQNIRKHLPDLVCILISVERDSYTLRQAITAGAQAYLTKPFTAHELSDAIRRAREDVWVKRRRLEQLARLRQQRDTYLQDLAKEYIKTRRADKRAMQVFEQLAQKSDCDLYLLKTLAVIYVFQQEWAKLEQLASRLTHSQSTSMKPLSNKL